MKTGKKALALLLCLLMLLSVMPAALASETEAGSAPAEDIAAPAQESAEEALTEDEPAEAPRNLAGGVAVDSTNFPDSAFLSYIKKNFDTDGDLVLSEDEIANATSIVFSASGLSKVADLTGIDYFVNLTKLSCPGQNLTSLDVSKNTALESLGVLSNKLTSLDLSKNTALKSLTCAYNQLTKLDLSCNTALTFLSCSGNNLTSLDLSHNTELNRLFCINNKITSLDITGTKVFISDEESGLGNQQNGASITVFMTSAQQAAYLTYAESGSNDNIEVLISDPIAVSAENFPDAVFRGYVSDTIDTNHDGLLNSTELGFAATVDVSDKGIKSLQGIEYFEALTELYCSNNQLTSLDVSKNPALLLLQCTDNQLTSLDVSKNEVLEQLNCGNNLLTSLDVSENRDLSDLSCEGNKLTSLDVEMCTALTDLDCSDNQISSLSLTSGSNLEALYCRNNLLTELDLDDAGNLNILFCDGNKLTSLDVSDIYELRVLDCSGNALTSLDISENPALWMLFCNNNQLTELTLEQHSTLSYLGCSGNAISSLNIIGTCILSDTEDPITQTVFGAQKDGAIISVTMTSAQKECYDKYCAENPANVKVSISVFDPVAINDTNFPDASFRSYIRDRYDDDLDGILSASELATAYEIDVSDMGISSLKGIEYFFNLLSLECYDNNLTSLDVSGLTSLGNLDCSSNQLTSLNVSGCTELKELLCSYNQLTSLDVSSCTKLGYLYCENNLLTSLDVSGIEGLGTLTCQENRLTKLDLSKNTMLFGLACNDNLLTSLDLSNNPMLVLLTCNGNRMKALDIRGTQLLSIGKAPEGIAVLVGAQQDSGSITVTMTSDQKDNFNKLYALYGQNDRVTVATGLLGDVNNSGSLTLEDVSLLYHYLTGKTGAAGLSLGTANVDLTGSVNLRDVAALFKLCSK